MTKQPEPGEMPEIMWFENHTYDHNAYWIGKNREGEGRTKYIRADLAPLPAAKTEVELIRRLGKAIPCATGGTFENDSPDAIIDAAIRYIEAQVPVAAQVDLRTALFEHESMTPELFNQIIPILEDLAATGVLKGGGMTIHYLACYYGKPLIKMTLSNGWRKFEVLKIYPV